MAGAGRAARGKFGWQNSLPQGSRMTQKSKPRSVGVAVTSLPGRPGFHRVRTPAVDHHQVAASIRASAGLRADPAELLAAQAPGLRIVPPPGDVA